MLQFIWNVIVSIFWMLLGAVLYSLLPRKVRTWVTLAVRRVIRLMVRAGQEALEDADRDAKDEKLGRQKPLIKVVEKEEKQAV